MRISSLLDFLARPRNLWGVIFLYTLVSGLFVQLILLPFIAPSWHKSHGLIRDMDGIKFHGRALELSERIKSDGWGSWEPTPDGLLISGIGAIFYTLIYPEPWSMLPLNSALNAFAGVAFFALLSFFVTDPRRNVIATLPFVFFPSALLWNTQLHNEIFVVPCVIFLLLGWAVLADAGPTGMQQKPVRWVAAIGLIAVAGMIIVLIRDETLRVMYLMALALSIGFTLYWLGQTIKHRLPARSLLLYIFVSSLACVAMFPAPSALEKILHPNTPKNTDGSIMQKSIQSEESWEEIPWMPDRLDHQFRVMAKKRAFFISASGKAGSALDSDVYFNSAADVLNYMPRAAQIGLFSPFPNLWFTEAGSPKYPWLTENPSRTAMRIESAFEMMFAYVCLLGLPILIWKKRRQPALLPILVFCLSLILLYALTTPNQGALYRLRYPQYMTLVSLGLAGWLTIKEPTPPEKDTNS